MDWPYDDWYFLRRCVAIWNQRGAYSTVTWQWPDGLACPEYSRSVTLLEELTHAHNLRVITVSWVALTLLSAAWLCALRHSRGRARCVCYA